MRSLVGLAMLVSLAILGYLGARYWQSAQEQDIRLIDTGKPCDIGLGDCAHPLPDAGQVIVSLNPRPVPLMQKVKVEVRTLNTPLIPVYLEITGINMNMGVNRVNLQPGEHNAWHGETIIPLCSRRWMHWRAALVLKVKGRSYRIDDIFDTVHR